LRRRVESIIGILSYMDLAHYPVHSTPRLWLEGIRRASGAAGYTMENFTPNNTTRDPALLSRMLNARCIRGLILHVGLADFERLAIDKKRHFAFVALGLPMSGGPVDLVCNDHGHSVQIAIQNLLRLGYRRIGLAINIKRFAIDGKRSEHAASAMLAAMLAWQFQSARSSGGTTSCGSVPPMVDPDWNPATLLAWYRREKPDAIICSDHLVIDWLRDAGVPVPSDRGVGVTFAHLDLDPSWKGIAGVDQCNDEVGAAAMDLLISLLNGNRFGLPAHPRTVKLQGTWIDGATAPPRRPAQRSSK
jgi:DNA-binding LacI/PurR family transcriptional regulator